jgi:putative acetyltransferase
MILPEVLPLRHASRELVRELGFLQGREPTTQLAHSHCHALIEIEARGTVGQGELPGLLRLDKSTASRIVSELETRGWVRARSNDRDARARVLSLTAKGRSAVATVHRQANGRVESALRLLGDSERNAVLKGMQIYARALERARRRALYSVRPIAPRDRADVATLIRSVMPEFGAKGAGFAIQDPEVDDMYGAYQDKRKRAAYWVVTRAETRGRKPKAPAEIVVGGGGFAPLVGGDEQTCELRKMYFYPEVRGLGFGQELLDRSMEGARRAGFSRMYLETLEAMTQAKALYRRNGFEPLCAAEGRTGHFGCNAYYARALVRA